MSKAKQANPDRPRVDPLGDLKIAEAKGKPITNSSCRFPGANQ